VSKLRTSRPAGAERSAPPERSTARQAGMTAGDIARVEAYLRTALAGRRIHIRVPRNHSASVEVMAGDEFLGTLHRDDEDGEVSFSLHISILEEDLPTDATQKKIG
jgi:hypothetical protein